LDCAISKKRAGDSIELPENEGKEAPCLCFGLALPLVTAPVKGRVFARRVLLVFDQIAGVLFDWDGVLLDSLGAACNVYNKIFSKIGAERLTRDEYLRFQSPNWYDFYESIGLPKTLWKEVDREWLRLYQEERPNLHPDALDCLGSLRRANLKLALVSNGSKSRIEGELVRFGLDQYFEAAVFGERKEELKPSPVMLERALGVLGVDARKAAYLGDSPADVQAAKSAGVPSIAIARGPIQKERLGVESPDQIFGGLEEATEFLVGLVPRSDKKPV